MIVKLCNTDLLKLVNDEKVYIDPDDPNALPVMVEATTDERSTIVGQTPVAASSAKGGGNRRARPKKTGQRWMRSLYGGQCYSRGCRTALLKGDWIVYDYDMGRPLCAGHGEQNFPNLTKPEEVNA